MTVLVVPAFTVLHFTVLNVRVAALLSGSTTYWFPSTKAVRNISSVSVISICTSSTWQGRRLVAESLKRESCRAYELN